MNILSDYPLLSVFHKSIGHKGKGVAQLYASLKC